LCVAVGVFDGVHLGHRKVIEEAARRAGESGSVHSVLTFDPHPDTVLIPSRAPALLTTMEEKLALLRHLGVQLTVVATFDKNLVATAAESFVQRVLVDRLHARCVVVGRDWRFGAGGSGTPDLLERMARRSGYHVCVVPPLVIGRRKVSSTRIRGLLTRGDAVAAGELLGQNYGAVGQVVAGEGMGRRLGYPTANLEMPQEKLLPTDGVYACWAGLRRLWPAVTYIGTRPTFSSELRRRTEVHLLDHKGRIDLLGRRLRVEFVQRLRGDRRFASADALAEQMARDCTRARHLLTALHD
jgi:riboflavin kinase/FMN adenylyltransferase